jgi:hypothetical protein
MTTRIAFIDALNAKGRCEIASARLVADEPGYDPLVILPSDAWEPLSTAEVAALRPGTDTPDSAVHEVIRLPVEPQELERIRERSVEFDLATGDQASPFDPFAGRHPSVFLGHTDSPAGARTTTVDQSVDRRTGLHIDNWDKLPLATRTRSRRRLAVNFGPGDRYMVVATLDIDDLHAAHPIDAPFPRTAHVREFMRDGGSLRCVRVRFEPGEGYIAPTELVPHDGSTLGIEQPSRIAFWLGHWPVGEFPAAVS